MADDELRHFVDSNARTAQAMLDAMAETRMEREELREGTQRVQAAIERLIIIQEGVSNILVRSVEFRPLQLCEPFVLQPNCLQRGIRLKYFHTICCIG